MTQAEAFKPESIAIADLQADPHNARQHNERNIVAVKASLARFGWRSCVVARRSDRLILAGHARVEAAKRLGWTHAPVLLVDDSMTEGMAFALADNRTAELAEWDMEELSRQVIELQPQPDLLGSIGFSAAELDNLMRANWPEDQKDDDGDLDDHRRAQKGDTKQSKVTVVLTNEQLTVALAALEKMRETNEGATLGTMIEILATNYIKP